MLQNQLLLPTDVTGVLDPAGATRIPVGFWTRAPLVLGGTKAMARRRISDSLPGDVLMIGTELVACRQGCKGIHLNPAAGIVPRCLMLEGHASGTPPSERKGAVVVGLNPGRTSSKEAAFYLARGLHYRALKEWWRLSLSEHPYYAKIRPVIRSLGIGGRILWTDVAKCELPDGAQNADLPDGTLDACAERFLAQELDLPPQRTWPVFALSDRAYQFVRQRFPHRVVVGLLHPTGSWGDQFARTLSPSGKALRQDYEPQVRAILGAGRGAIWVGSTGVRQDS